MKNPKILDRGQMKEAKICPVCGRPFTIRKKWKDCFDQVIYCSDKCRMHKKSPSKVSPNLLPCPVLKSKKS